MAFATHNLPLDSALQLKDAGALTSTAVTQVGGVDAVIDLGSARFQKGTIILDISAIDTANGDESYTIDLQGSTASNFSSVHVLARAALGDSTLNGGATDTVIGRRVLYWDNVATITAGEPTPLRYLRLRVFIAGTTPSINFQAWATMDL